MAISVQDVTVEVTHYLVGGTVSLDGLRQPQLHQSKREEITHERTAKKGRINLKGTIHEANPPSPFTQSTMGRKSLCRS